MGPEYHWCIWYKQSILGIWHRIQLNKNTNCKNSIVNKNHINVKYKYNNMNIWRYLNVVFNLNRFFQYLLCIAISKYNNNTHFLI